MSEQAETPSAFAPNLRAVKTGFVVATVLSLAWIYYYLRELNWQFEPWVAARLSFLPAGGVKFLRAVLAYVAVLLPMFVFFVLAVRIGLWLDVRRLASPGAMLDAYREGSRQGAASARESIEKILREANDLPPEEAAELRVEMEQIIRRTEENAAHREKLYAENPALLENEMRMAMESIRKKQQEGES